MVGTAARKDALSVTLLILFPEFKLAMKKIRKKIFKECEEGTYVERLFQLYTQRRISPNIMKYVRTFEKYNC